VKQPDRQPEVLSPSDVARRLKGDLPCIACGYNLKQLSVLDVCPECGTPVRATVLSVVDPYASVLQPVRFPWLVASGLVVWSAAALAAALITWVLRAVDVVAVLSESQIRLAPLALLGAICTAGSGMASAVLVRPHAKVPAWQSVLAACGVLTSLGAAWMYWRIQGVHDPVHVRPFLESVTAQPARAWLRIETNGLLIVSLLLLRPAARMLAARSLVLRMGRVDRQTMLAMATALAVATVGDFCRLGALVSAEPFVTALNTLGLVLIAIGSMLFTVGLFGVLTDCIRIARVIVRPPASLSDVVEDSP
jgi:hypothetical protein